MFITVCVIPGRVYVAGLKLGKMLRRREAQPLIRGCGLGEPAVDRLGDSLLWVLFATGQLGKRRRRGHGKAWRQL